MMASELLGPGLFWGRAGAPALPCPAARGPPTSLHGARIPPGAPSAPGHVYPEGPCLLTATEHGKARKIQCFLAPAQVRQCTEPAEDPPSRYCQPNPKALELKQSSSAARGQGVPTRHVVHSWKSWGLQPPTGSGVGTTHRQAPQGTTV